MQNIYVFELNNPPKNSKPPHYANSSGTMEKFY